MELHITGKAHAEASCLLYKASIEQGEDEGADDPIAFAFNGPYSLSVQYLLGLGLELMLKSAIVAWDQKVDSDYLQKKVGHDLLTALKEAEHRGFTSQSRYLRDIVEVLHAPYKQHWLRYERPKRFNLPADFDQVVEALTVLENDLATKLNLRS
jgi:hypothetical protein